MISEAGKNEVLVLTFITGLGLALLPPPWNWRFAAAMLVGRVVIMVIRVMGDRIRQWKERSRV